jgi:hypothetical protein
MGGCKNKKLIGPYLDGQLGDCRWLDEHISECSECLAEYEAVQRINHLAQKADCSLPESSYWRNFTGRVTNRVITRQAETPTHGLGQIFAGWKILMRPAAFSSVMLLSIAAFLIFYQFGDNPQTTNLNINVAQNAIDSNAITPEEKIKILSEPAQISIVHAAANPITPIDTILKDNINKNDIAGFSENRDQVFNAQLPIGGLRSIIKPGANLVESDIKVFGKPELVNLSSLNSDQVIKYQIFSGSNPSLIPLSFYYQAATRFFGPEKTTPWRMYELLPSSPWGYAAGGSPEDAKDIKRLNLEFDLIKDK